MEFKSINTRAMILVTIAGILIMMTCVINFKSKAADMPDDQTQPPVVPEHYHHPIFAPAGMGIPIDHVKTEDEDEAQEKEMKEQMDKDRHQQRQIKMLKMQLEQVNLQLDNEKALTEINKLKKENAGYVKDSNAQNGAGFPSVRVIYIGGTISEKEAILSIDGASYSVREKERPLEGLEILKITDKGVKIHFNTPQELTTVINYVQD